MIPIAFLARRRHLAEHMAPVWLALPEEARGPFLVSDDGSERCLRDMGIPATRTRSAQRIGRPLEGMPVVVAGYRDLLSVNGKAGRIALMAHGIGQSYAGRRDGASDWIGSPGGLDRGMVDLFLHPGPHPAARDRERYPRARVEVVGSPLLDRLHRKPRDGRDPVIAITTHWDPQFVPGQRGWQACPETHGALLCSHYGGWFGILDAIGELAKRYRVIGHGHPGAHTGNIDDMARVWEGMGIEVVRDFDEVCRRADLLVADNSSVVYEFAATGRPVVLLDPPWYDRDVGHGLRFWSASHVGLHVGDPRTLTDTVTEALGASGRQWRDREDALDMVYAHRDHAAERAAVALLDWAGERRMAA